MDILVATPGRLLDHVSQGTLDLSQVEILVLDEADRMLDMGFIRDIRKVLALLPESRQDLLFSATFSDEIKALADGLLNKPALIEVARRNIITSYSIHYTKLYEAGSLAGFQWRTQPGLSLPPTFPPIASPLAPPPGPSKTAAR